MNINGKNLCTYCFEEMNESQGPCSACGYEEGRKPQDAVLAPGTVLMGRYAVGRVLGKGGFGVTYLAYDLKGEFRVAIKEYMPDTLAYRTPGNTIISTYEGDKEESFRLGAEKFYEEAKTVSRFNGHPNIINVQEFFYENNTAYFVMEYIEGVDLKTYVTRMGGTLSQKECTEILTPILDALIVVHSVGVLHRDISPDNIYVTTDGGVKLLDFGAARQVLGEKSKSLSVVLKPGFAPIEQYQTRGKQGQWTDVYALAATMFYCLTGQVPEAAMDRVEAEMENRSADGVSQTLWNSGTISQRLAVVLRKALALRASERYQNMGEFKQALIAAQEQPQSPSQPAPLPLSQSRVSQKEVSYKEAARARPTVCTPGPEDVKSGKDNLTPVLLVCGAVVLLEIIVSIFSRDWTVVRALENMLAEAVISLLAMVAVAESYYCLFFKRSEYSKTLTRIFVFLLPAFIHAVAGYGYTVGQTYAYTVIAILCIAAAEVLFFRHTVIKQGKVNQSLLIAGMILMCMVPVIIWSFASRGVLLAAITKTSQVIWADSLLKGFVEALGAMTAMEIWLTIRSGERTGKGRIILLIACTIVAAICASAVRCFVLVYFTYTNIFEMISRYFRWISRGALMPAITMLLLLLAAMMAAVGAAAAAELFRRKKNIKRRPA